jgi:hypothetical protein
MTDFGTMFFQRMSFALESRAGSDFFRFDEGIAVFLLTRSLA